MARMKEPRANYGHKDLVGKGFSRLLVVKAMPAPEKAVPSVVMEKFRDTIESELRAMRKKGKEENQAMGEETEFKAGSLRTMELLQSGKLPEKFTVNDLHGHEDLAGLSRGSVSGLVTRLRRIGGLVHVGNSEEGAQYSIGDLESVKVRNVRGTGGIKGRIASRGPNEVPSRRRRGGVTDIASSPNERQAIISALLDLAARIEALPDGLSGYPTDALIDELWKRTLR